MNYLVLGVLAHLTARVYDVIALRKLPMVKTVLWVVGWGLWSYSLTMLSLEQDKLALPAWLGWLGWVLLVPSAVLMAYVLFISLPFRKIYLGRRLDGRPVTAGFYKLVRHPWVLLYSFLLISLLLVSRSQLMLLAVPCFIILSVLAALVEDRLFFDRMFEGYKEYRRQTPMFIPTRRSLKAFASSIRQTASG